VAGYLLVPLFHLVSAGSLSLTTLTAVVPTVAQQWLLLTLAAVSGHVAYLLWRYDARSAMIWLVKLVTDPLTDIGVYYSSPARLFLSSRTHVRKGEVA